MKTLFHLTYAGIFWLWNLTFLLVVYIGIFPHVAIPLARAAFAGEIEPEFLISILGIVGTPTVCTLIGWFKLRKRPLELIRLFYGIEAPLLLLFYVRSFLLRELTSASYLVLGTAFACIVAFSVELLWGYLGKQRDASVTSHPQTLEAAKRQKAWLILPWVQIAAHTLMLFIGVYVGAILLFHAIPVAAWLLEEFFSFRWFGDFWWGLTYYFWSALWYLPVFSILFAGSATLFLGMPSMLTALYVHSGQRILRAFSAQYGKMRTVQVVLGV
ncbi:MAG: PEP-CTERM sorting domain-containing protein, partial [Cyanobacteriota bacterium]|nr:PEP-CTERM sorting domain-containing protein [Cyanobacteriota bacterium]